MEQKYYYAAITNDRGMNGCVTKLHPIDLVINMIKENIPAVLLSYCEITEDQYEMIKDISDKNKAELIQPY